jgi:hypothetical protein
MTINKKKSAECGVKTPSHGGTAEKNLNNLSWLKEKTFFKKMSFLAPIQYLIWQMPFHN